MSAVTLAAIKIGGIMLGLEPWQTVISAGLITVIFSALGGFKGVVYTDFVLFFVAMGGSIGAAYYLVNIPEVGGIENSYYQSERIELYENFYKELLDEDLKITVLSLPLTTS